MHASFPWLRKTLRKLRRHHGSHESMEVIYRDLLVRELQKLGIEDRFFPVGSAANYSLLYLVLRCYVELPIRRVLDVGAGQTTLLLHALQEKLGKAEVITLEHDAGWAGRIASQVSHRVLRRDLVRLAVGGHMTLMHDTADLGGSFDLIIMDGPPGVRRYSRLGLLHLMQTVMDRHDFVAVLDDFDRAGEWQTAQLCEQWLRQDGIAFKRTEIRAAKHQWVCAGGALGTAAYF
jgi:hypothetical protein